VLTNPYPFLIFHIALTAVSLFVAIRFRNSIFGFVATVWIICTLVALWMFDRGGGLGIVFALIYFGGLLTPIGLMLAAGKALWVSVPALLLAALPTYLALKRVRLSAFSSKSAIVGGAVFVITATLCLEVMLSAVMWANATAYAESPFCLRRAWSWEMLVSELDYPARSAHAVLVDRDAQYLWSFEQMKFVPHEVIYGLRNMKCR